MTRPAYTYAKRWFVEKIVEEKKTWKIRASTYVEVNSPVELKLHYGGCYGGD